MEKSYGPLLTGQRISANDIILNIDNVPIDAIPYVKDDFVIRAANMLTILKPDGQIIDVEVSSLDFTDHFYFVLVIPACYYFLTFFIVLYLYCKQKTPRY
ncbi:hypothetical protein [Lysinibacillus varians]|uniref:hypothetical protein n=1 Tax=Lysinibacillus varians TaxID=1145276 RepID=UPI0026CC635A|nr:hypothetical protein [Lysinibacillus varians]